MKRVIQTAAAIAMLAYPAVAGPDDTSKALMKDSVSMLDWGMLMLKFELENTFHWLISGENRSGRIYTDYDFNRDTITINLVSNSTDPEYKELAYFEWSEREYCTSAISDLRAAAGLDPKTGEYRDASLAHSVYADMFTHSGFKSSESNEADLRQLDAKFELSVFVGPYHCEGNLMSSEVSVVDW